METGSKGDCFDCGGIDNRDGLVDEVRDVVDFSLRPDGLDSTSDYRLVKLTGDIDYRPAAGETKTAAIALTVVSNNRDTWVVCPFSVAE